MAWEFRYFRRLYYRVAGGPEYEWPGVNLPPMYDTAESDVLTHAGTNWDKSWSYNKSVDMRFYDLAAMNGGNGLNFWSYFNTVMSNGQEILIYKDRGAQDVAALVLRKTAGGIAVGVRYNGNDTIQTGTAWGIFSIDSSNSTHPDVINVSSINIGFLKNGNNYTLFDACLGGEDGDYGNDVNYYRVDTVATGGTGSIVSNMIKYLLNDNEPIPNDDPYKDTGESAEDQLQTGPAQGDGDDTSDVISIPGAPALNLTLNHFISAYVPSLTDINDLADYVWGEYDRTDNDKKMSKLFANPSDAIIGLFMLPFTPGSSTAIPVTIGKFSSGVSMPPLSAQFKDVNCGSLTVNPYWGNYLDHNPYARYTLVLPYVGEVQLDPDEIVGQTISVKYRVDCLTGSFVCFVSTATKILAQYQGNCSLQVPVSSADYSRLNSAILQAAMSAVGTAVGVGAAGAANGAAGMAGALANDAGNLASSALNLQQSKVNHSHSGSLGGASGFMGTQKPYLLIHRARQSVPTDANKFKGYPCNANFTLSDLEGMGFTSVRQIRLDGIKLTEGELEELRQILAAGVYL